MSDDLKERMNRLREIAPRLNSATDQASKLVAMVETLLVDELHLGIPAKVAFDRQDQGPDDDGNFTTMVRFLAFDRINGQFRIHVAIDHDVLDSQGRPSYTREGDIILWPSCAREVKLMAFKQLPALLDSIISEAERLAETAEATAAKIKAMVGDPESPPSTPGVIGLDVDAGKPRASEGARRRPKG